MLNVGDLAPDFSATTQQGQTFSLSALRGKRAVLFFFPKAMSTGCTIQTRLFRDHYTEIAALGAELIGISAEPSEKQCEFASREGVSFPMLGDANKQIGKKYQVLWPILGINRRVTYIVGPDGRIEAVFHHELLVGRHLEDVLTHLKSKTSNPYTETTS
jgi:peroxiredoxin Q/BCP